MRSPADGRRDRALLGGLVVAAFGLSAVTDVAWLLGGWALAALLLRRSFVAALRRALRSVLPATVGLSAASWAWLWLLRGEPPAGRPFVALALRAALIATVTLAVLGRVDLARALQPSPALSRLLAITLAQVHALRLLWGEARLGLVSRLPRRPRALDVLRDASGITGTMVAMTARNAREVAEAMRARGF